MQTRVELGKSFPSYEVQMAIPDLDLSFTLIKIPIQHNWRPFWIQFCFVHEI